jgi:hypothetical protein
MSRQKKERERRLLEAFFELAGIAGRVEEEREAPDFLIRVEAKLIGVELTEVYVPTSDNEFPPKARESLASKILDEAQRRYESTGGERLQVAVGFSPNTNFRTLNRTETAKAIAEFLLAQELLINRPQTWRPTLHGPLSFDINFVTAFALPSQAPALWYSPQAGWVVPLTEGILQSCIDMKSSKLSKYRSAAMESWLVLVVAGGAPSQGFDLRPDINSRAIRSPFDQTFLLSLIDSAVHKLGVAS